MIGLRNRDPLTLTDDVPARGEEKNARRNSVAFLRWLCLFSVAAVFASVLVGDDVVNAQSALPAYLPQQHVSGTIRIWGYGSRRDDYVGSLVRAWEAAFVREQPNIKFANGMLGNASAIGGLYTGAADIALMDRVAWPIEIDGYQELFHHDPAGFTVATGSIDVPHYAPALVMLANRANPLAHVSIAQLDALYDANRLRGAAPVRSWGDLGDTGTWAARPIHIYGYRIASQQDQFFERAVMGKGDQNWNCTLRIEPSEKELVRAIAADPDALGFASLANPDPLTKSLAIVPQGSDRPVSPTRATVASRAYPLAQPIWIYINQAPGKSADSKVAEFLRFILSRDGQAIIATHGGYLPLPSALALTEREKVK